VPMLIAGKAAPHFQLTTIAGTMVAMEEALRKGPLLLGFFKISCPVCQYTLPFLERIHQQLNGRGVQIWGIAQDSLKDAIQFSQTYGLTFPILIDEPPYKTSRQYGLEIVPSLFLVKPDGHIEQSSEGFAKADLLNIQRSLAQSYSIAPPALFLPTESVPAYRPG